MVNKTNYTQKQGSIELKFLLYTTPVHPQEDGTPNFFNESRSSLLVLSIDVSFVSKNFWKGDKNQTSGPIYMADPVLQYWSPNTSQKGALDTPVYL